MSLQNENLEELFNELRGTFDQEEAPEGHQQRFLEKLNASKGVVSMPVRKRNWWKPLSIAASVVLLIGLGIGFMNQQQTVEQRVAEISPEASQTHFYFASLIEEQVRELEKQNSPETELIITDTMQQLDKLEQDYKQMEQDLLNGGDSRLILSAMIVNFQTRIDLLQEVMNQIDSIKNLKTIDDENFTI